MTWFFFDRHWDTQTRQVAKAVSGELLFLSELVEQGSGDEGVFAFYQNHFSIKIAFNPPPEDTSRCFGSCVFVLHKAREVLAPRAVVAKSGGDGTDIYIKLKNGEWLEAAIVQKRLSASTALLFLVFVLISALVLGAIAVRFSRTQVRTVKQLADAMDAFGTGLQELPLRYGGANEVRLAIGAFNKMKVRITRLITQRVQMLAGVSHDIKSVLTRMNLALNNLKTLETRLDQTSTKPAATKTAFGKTTSARTTSGKTASRSSAKAQSTSQSAYGIQSASQSVSQSTARATHAKMLASIKADIKEMEGILNSYLDFVQGGSEEEVRTFNLTEELQKLARPKTKVKIKCPPALIITTRPLLVKRILTNLITNGLRYGTKVLVTATYQRNRQLILTVEDNGPGIPPAERGEVLNPFYRGDNSRTPGKGGTGLGLTIVRDGAWALGGDVAFTKSALGGAKATVRLPL